MHSDLRRPALGRLSPILVLLMCVCFAGAPTAEAQSRQSARDLEQQIYRSFDLKRYHAAIDQIDEYLELRPNDPHMLYNMACARALIGERDNAASTLRRAVEAGFVAFGHMRNDPDLESIRDHPTYKAILLAADDTAQRGAQRVISRWRNRFGSDDYTYEVDEARNLCYATSLDPVAQQETRAMLETQADHLKDTLFGAMPPYYVLVALPTPRHADELLKGDSSVGGLYDHGQRVLVTRNVGGSLRHEFFHLMHYGHMERIGQDHPLWIQEGMASLYEDYELSDDGDITFTPNERHNIVRRLARAGRLMSWDRLMRIEDRRFMADAAQLYPQVRSIFEFIADGPGLAEFYRVYVKHYPKDETGRKAIEMIFDDELDEIERRWRRWVVARPAVDRSISRGDAAIGILADPHATNDGVLIDEILEGTSAARSALRVGDVIVGIDSRPTRSLNELQAVIAMHSPGDVIRVRARRGEEYYTTAITLKALDSGRVLNRR